MTCAWPGCTIDPPTREYGGRAPTYKRKYCDKHLLAAKRKNALAGKERVDRRLDARGNVMLRREKNGKSIWVREHREMMETFLGRPLREGEEVLHKNGQKDDNRKDNLLLRTVLPVEELWRLTTEQNCSV